jgi:hypothetical protein
MVRACLVQNLREELYAPARQFVRGGDFFWTPEILVVVPLQITATVNVG